MQIPPGHTSLNTDQGQDHGYRSWPGATWVHEPGCYGLQADGTNFTSRFASSWSTSAPGVARSDRTAGNDQHTTTYPEPTGYRTVIGEAR